MKTKFKFKAYLIPLLALAITSCGNVSSPFSNDIIPNYDVRFLDDSGNVIYQTVVEEHDNVSFNGTLPSKESTAYYDYSFAGWKDVANASEEISDLKNILKDTDFSPVFSENDRYYTVKFYNEDKSQLLQEVTVKAGEEAYYTGPTPTKPSTSTEEFYFIGWSSPVVGVLGNLEVTPIFGSTPIEYIVNFYEDQSLTGEPLWSEVVSAGSYATYGGKTPQKADYRDPNGEYKIVYTFEGWNQDISTTVIDSNRNFYAIWSERRVQSDRDTIADHIEGNGTEEEDGYTLVNLNNNDFYLGYSRSRRDFKILRRYTSFENNNGIIRRFESHFDLTFEEGNIDGKIGTYTVSIYDAEVLTATITVNFSVANETEFSNITEYANISTTIVPADAGMGAEQENARKEAKALVFEGDYSLRSYLTSHGLPMLY